MKPHDLPCPTVAAPVESELLELASGTAAQVRFRQSLKARLYAIQVRQNGTVSVTIPRRGTLKAARQFLESRRAWIERVLRRLRGRAALPEIWEPGLEILFRGNRLPLGAEPDGEQFRVSIGEEFCGLADDSRRFRATVERHLQTVAARELPARLVELARRLECPLRRITVRNQRTRWGSCSRRGAISLNWRLVQLPEAVIDYVLIHELMHLREMNHSPRFWAHVERACPAYREHRRWLKSQGPMLCG